MNGWIKLHRQFLDWEWYKDSNTKALFIHLLMKANHETKKWKGINIDRGQVITGRKQLSIELGMSEQSIRTSMNRLISTNEITSKTTNKFSLITVIKYNFYQSYEDGNQQTNQQLTNNQPTTNQQLTTTKELKKEKNIRTKESNIKMPFDSEKFLEAWNNWKEYKKKEHRFTYKSEMSEQAALMKLAADSGNSEASALEMIFNSIANGYKGLFKTKETNKPKATYEQIREYERQHGISL